LKIFNRKIHQPEVFQHKRVCWQWTKWSQKCLPIAQEILANGGESGRRP